MGLFNFLSYKDNTERTDELEMYCNAFFFRRMWTPVSFTSRLFYLLEDKEV